MNFNFTTEDIYNKKFKKKMRGFDCEAVNEFLNDIMDDYEAYQLEIDNLKKQNKELRDENFKIKMNVLKNNTSTMDLKEVKPVEKDFNENEKLNQIEKKIIELEKEVAVINAKIER